jgi:hypothetical protein
MSFNHGRPVLIGDDPSIRLGRQFLEHPLSNIGDSRLVAACELLQRRRKRPIVSGLTAERRHLTMVDSSVVPSLGELVDRARSDYDVVNVWLAEWTDFYGEPLA